MTRLIEILISFAIVFVLFLLIGVFLPSSRHLVEKVETNRKLTIVYDLLSSVRRFTDWNPVLLHDPKANITRSGPDSGVGAQIGWTSDARGVPNASWKIVEAEPGKRIKWAIESDTPGSGKQSEFTFKRVGNRGRNVEVTQTYDVQYGFNPIARYAGLYVSSSVGEDIKLGLQRLNNALATIPNVDYGLLQQQYKAPVPTIQPRAAETVLFVTAAIPVDREKIQNQMSANQEWIRKVMASNGLEAAGPVRIITNEQGSQTYSFDVAQPVRKAGVAGKIEGIKLEGPVKVAHNDAGRVVSTTFKGDMGNLQNLRDALRAWALARGYETVDRPYEAWTGGIPAGFTEEGQFTVFWAVK
ncbi:SRPBCC family protein [Lysobacter humi (ex Lee et al. 2017)]